MGTHGSYRSDAGRATMRGSHCDGGIPRVDPPAVDGRGELGRQGEAVAEAFLRARAYTIVARNFRCRAGEIDLVALDGRVVVFVEVRSRRGTRAGTPLESVDVRKRAQVARVAEHFVATRGWHDREARFDVVGVRFDSDPPRVEHVRNAFDART
jgi:putative endonuclease